LDFQKINQQSRLKEKSNSQRLCKEISQPRILLVLNCIVKVALLSFKKGTFATQKRTYAFSMKLFLQNHYDNLV
jgi:hypothetical protein